MIAPIMLDHISLAVTVLERARRFYDPTMADGPPGPRPSYGPGYYAAFVRDPDGNHLEAVHHG